MINKFMKKIMKFSTFSIAICMLVGSFMFTASARNMDPGNGGGSTGVVKSQVVYDYPDEWKTSHFRFESTISDHTTYIVSMNEDYSTDLVVSSVTYGISGRTHYCTYTGMVPNWGQTTRTVCANY